MSTGWVAFAGTVLLGLLIGEMRDVAGWLCPKVIAAAARRVPEEQRERRREEWLAELAAYDSLKLLKFGWSLRVYVGARRIARARRLASPQSASDRPGAIASMRLRVDVVAAERMRRAAAVDEGTVAYFMRGHGAACECRECRNAPRHLQERVGKKPMDPAREAARRNRPWWVP